MNPTTCPEPEYLQQFLLGALPIQEIESCQEHLSVCDPCMETVNGLKVDDTFTNLTRQAWMASAEQHPDEAVNDDEVVGNMMQQIGQWEFGKASVSGPSNAHLRDDRAAEVQRLLGEPVLPAELGQLAHYRIIELLGCGSTGVVYLASDTRLERSVVLKVLRPSLGEAARKRFTAEAKATAAIDHPNVVTIYEVGKDGPLAYIAMQWLPGQTLEQKLAVSETLELDDLKRIATQIATGLAEAHSRGLIHRDIKPANIWIPDGPGEVKILDFGLVRITDEDPKLTCTGIIAGTPCYMSPEQSRGEPLDPRSDLFSLGCLMYQSLAGRLPFHSDNALATLRSIQQDQPTPLSELDPSLPGDLADLVMCLLEKSPARRPPNAQAVVRALESDRDDWGFEVRPAVSNPELAPRRRKRYTIWKSIAALIAAGLIGVAGTMYGQQIIRIVTNQGEIEIETNVDDVKIEVVQEGNVVRVIDLATQQSIEIKAGQYQIRPVGHDNSISIDRNQLVLSRGAKEIVKITRSPSGSELGVASHVASADKGNQPVPQGPLPIPPTTYRPIVVAPIVELELMRLEKDYQDQKARFDRSEISRIELLDAEAAMLELKTILPAEAVDANHLRRLVEIRSEQFNLASQLPESADSPESNSDSDQLRKAARKNLRDARNRLNGFENSMGLTPSLPIYDGKTYEQLLAIVRSERDLSKLNPALKGIANLASENEQAEMLDAVMQIARRGVGIASEDESKEFKTFIGQLFQTLNYETLANLFINELANGTDNSRSLFFNRSNRFGTSFWRVLEHNMRVDEDKSSAVANRVFAALEKFASTDSRLRSSYEFLLSLSKYTGWHSTNLSENPSVRNIFQVYFDKHFKDHELTNDSVTANFIALIPASPKTTGLLRKVEEAIKDIIVRFDQLTGANDAVSHNEIQKQLELVFMIVNAFPESTRPLALQLELANAALEYHRANDGIWGGSVAQLTSERIGVDVRQLMGALQQERSDSLVRFELKDVKFVIKTDGLTDDQEND